MKRKDRDHISLDKIAAECGVSPMTVSRALRQLPSVSANTRERILKAAAELGYLPTLRAGRKPELRGEVHSRPVQLIIRETDGHIVRFHAELLIELVRLLAEKNYECIVRVVNGDYEEFIRVLNLAGKCDAAATLLVGAFPEKELRSLLRTIPGAILLDDPGNSVADCLYSIFSFDNVQAASLAVNHLLKCKRKRILLVTGPADHFFSAEVERGYRSALEIAGIAFDPELIVHTDFTVSDAVNKVSALLDQGIQFDGVFTNDEMAGGVYRALLSRKRRIPEDVAVCGCDGLPIGEQLYPTLTTVVLDYRQLAARVIDEITSGNNNGISLHLRLLPTILQRESSL
ncbi:MAG: LacI family DNA-binding transcriptional regulator [Lentisphaeria bacterium]|nr:LacI family DNA-binding transcriptional regulator [Lentisphaeria bacterium]